MTCDPRISAPRRITDVDKVAALLATAFVSLAITKWLVPDDPVRRVACLRAQFALQVRHVLRGQHGRIVGLRERRRLVAAAVWIEQPGTAPLPGPHGYVSALRRITGEHYPRFRALNEAFAASRPRVPHHHLALLGAVPPGHGRGTALLHHYLDWIDRRPGDRPLVHLDASNLRAARLYEQHGFRHAGPMAVAGDGPPIYPMHRPPPPNP